MNFKKLLQMIHSQSSFTDTQVHNREMCHNELITNKKFNSLINYFNKLCNIHVNVKFLVMIPDIVDPC